MYVFGSGEDTSAHQNDVVWYYDFAKGYGGAKRMLKSDATLTRMLTTPYGSETTSPYWYPNINGWAYIMAVVQHPYGESDQEKLYASTSCLPNMLPVSSIVPLF